MNYIILLFIYRSQALIGLWSLGFLTRQEQDQLLEWIKVGTKPIALFIEPIGQGEYLGYGDLKAEKKCYYDRLFKN